MRAEEGRMIWMVGGIMMAPACIRVVVGTSDKEESLEGRGRHTKGIGMLSTDQRTRNLVLTELKPFQRCLDQSEGHQNGEKRKVPDPPANPCRADLRITCSVVRTCYFYFVANFTLRSEAFWKKNISFFA